MKVRCGDANPNGNVWFLFKGGCGKDLDIKDAYRCTGCGGFFHLDCIFKHFELEEGHDYARNALAKIKTFVLESTMHIKERRKIQSLIREGLDRKPESRRIKL
jgi:hypothetical protein